MPQFLGFFAKIFPRRGIVSWLARHPLDDLFCSKVCGAAVVDSGQSGRAIDLIVEQLGLAVINGPEHGGQLDGVKQVWPNADHHRLLMDWMVFSRISSSEPQVSAELATPNPPAFWR